MIRNRGKDRIKLRGMYIINSKFGQQSNRLWVLAKGISTALEDGDDIIITSFNDLSPKYRCELPKECLTKIHVKKSYLCDLDLNIAKIANKLTGIDKLDRKIGRIKFITYPQDGSDAYLEKYGEALRYFFEPKNDQIDKVRVYYDSIRKDYDKIVGVHIRRGDYAQWMGGNYYFNNSTYIKYMDELKKLYSGEKIVFVMLSDEKLEKQDFEEYDVVFPNGNAIEDQWILSKCDHILCTRSTFSSWACFMGGGIPTWTILSDDEITDARRW